jgi:RNA polymerase sigma-70 factor (ECF subfamily)
VLTSVEGRPLDETEEQLVERAQKGDVPAYEELVRRYQDVAFHLAYTITGSADEAQDAAQEGFLRAYHALPRFRAASRLRPWLLTIVANAARSRRSAATRHPTLALSAAADRPSDDSAQSPEAAALAAERRRELLAAVNALTGDDQLVIAYRYFLDLTEAEMAAAIGCPRGTVKSRLSRALGRLRQQLATTSRATHPPRFEHPSPGGSDG